MKRAFAGGLLAVSLTGCETVAIAPVSGTEVVAIGEAIAVVQADTYCLTALFHLISFRSGCDLDEVVNKLMVKEAVAMGASRVEIKNAWATPRDTVHRLLGLPLINLIGITHASATGVAVK